MELTALRIGEDADGIQPIPIKADSGAKLDHRAPPLEGVTRIGLREEVLQAACGIHCADKHLPRRRVRLPMLRPHGGFERRLEHQGAKFVALNASLLLRLIALEEAGIAGVG